MVSVIPDTIEARLAHIEQMLARLDCDARDARVAYAAQVTFLDNPRLKLRRDIPVVVAESADEVSVTWPEVDLTALGESRAEAFLAFEADLGELFEDLAATPDAELGPLPLRWKHILFAAIEQR